MADVNIEIEAALKGVKESQAQIANLAKVVSEELKKIEAQAEKTSKSTASISSTLSKFLPISAIKDGIDLFKDLAGALAAPVQAAIEDEKALNDLNNALARTGQFSAETSQSMQAFAEQIQATTTFQDDQVLSAAALIQTIAKLDKEGLQKATKAATDLSKAFKIDLNSAAEIVAKSAEGNVTALNRLGVQFQKGKDDAETFANALKAIESSAGGAAAAETNTFGGALQQTSNAFGNLQEAIGRLITGNSIFITALKATGTALNDLAQFIDRNSESIKNLFTALVSVGPEIARTFNVAANVINAAFIAIFETLNQIPGLSGKFDSTIASLQADFQSTEQTIASLDATLDNLGSTDPFVAVQEGLEKTNAAAKALGTTLSQDSIAKITELESKYRTAGLTQTQVLQQTAAAQIAELNKIVASEQGTLAERQRIANLIGKIKLDVETKVGEEQKKIAEKIASQNNSIISNLTNKYKTFGQSREQIAIETANEEIAQIEKVAASTGVITKEQADLIKRIREATSDKVKQIQEEETEKTRKELEEQGTLFRKLADAIGEEAAKMGLEIGGALASTLGGLEGKRELNIDVKAETSKFEAGLLSAAQGFDKELSAATARFNKDMAEANKQFQEDVGELQAELDELNDPASTKEGQKLQKELGDLTSKLGKTFDPSARAEIEAQIDQKKIDFEDEVADKKKSLEDEIKQKKLDFEKEAQAKKLAFEEEQNAKKLAFEEEQRAKQLAFQTELNAKVAADEKARADEFDKRMYDAAAGFVSTVGETVASAFLGEEIGGIVGGLLDLLSKGPQVVQEVVQGFLGALPKVLENIGLAGPALIQGLINGIPVLLQGLIRSIPVLVQGLISAIPGLITSLVSFLVEGIPTLFQELVNAIPTVIFAIIDGIPMIIQSIILSIPKIITALISSGPQIVTAIIAQLPKIAIEMIKSMIVETPKFVVQLIKSFVAEMLKIPGKLIDSIGKGISDIFKPIIDFFKDVFGGIGGEEGLFGTGLLSDEGIFGIEGIPLLAEGGVVPPGFPNDSFFAGLTSGEAVINPGLTERLDDFLNGQTGGGGPSVIQVTLVVGEKELARTLIDLERSGFRTSESA
jgi:hypothetical protein